MSISFFFFFYCATKKHICGLIWENSTQCCFKEQALIVSQLTSAGNIHFLWFPFLAFKWKLKHWFLRLEHACKEVKGKNKEQHTFGLSDEKRNQGKFLVNLKLSFLVCFFLDQFFCPFVYIYIYYAAAVWGVDGTIEAFKEGYCALSLQHVTFHGISFCLFSICMVSS